MGNVTLECTTEKGQCNLSTVENILGSSKTVLSMGKGLTFGMMAQKLPWNLISISSMVKLRIFLYSFRINFTDGSVYDGDVVNG